MKRDINVLNNNSPFSGENKRKVPVVGSPYAFFVWTGAFYIGGN